MGVKTIFKILFTTIIFIVTIILIVEMCNALVYASQINQLTKLGVKKACVFFTKETYKTNVGLLGDIYNDKGEAVLGGNIYDGNDIDSIYDSLYINNYDFKYWYEEEAKGVWNELDCLAKVMGLNAPMGSYHTSAIEAAKYQLNNYTTPINLGVTYLDRKTIEKIAQWNTLALFSGGNGKNIIKEELTGRTYVKYNGYRLYPTEMRVWNIEFEKLNRVNDSTRIKYLMGIEDFSSINFKGNELLVAWIYYDIPIAYEGVTPLQNLIEFANNYRVIGFNESIEEGTMTYNVQSSRLSSGGTKDQYNNTELPASGHISFILTR